MTAENCLWLLEKYKKKMVNGKTSSIKEQSKKNYENMLKHIQQYRPELLKDTKGKK